MLCVPAAKLRKYRGGVEGQITPSCDVPAAIEPYPIWCECPSIRKPIDRLSGRVSGDPPFIGDNKTANIPPVRTGTRSAIGN